jgi:hypothetical protein
MSEGWEVFLIKVVVVVCGIEVRVYFAKTM